MEIHFKRGHTEEVEQECTEILLEQTQRKLLGLQKLLGKENASQVYVEFGKDSGAHHSGKVWRTQVNLDCNGKRFHADATGEKLQISADLAINELKAELMTESKKTKSKQREEGGAVKAFLRGFRPR